MSHRLCESHKGIRRGSAGDVDVLFHSERHAMQWARDPSGRQIAICLGRKVERSLIHSTNDGVQVGVHLFDTVEVGTDDLGARNRAVCDQFGQATSGLSPEGVGVLGRWGCCRSVH